MDVEGQPPGQIDGATHADDISQRLLDAAAQVFGEKGFESARIAEIARKCGLSTGAVYSRWLSKQELFLAAVEHRAAEYAASVRAWSEPSASSALAIIGEQMLTSTDEAPRNILLEACVIARRDQTLGEDVGRSLDAESAVLSNLVERGKADGEIDEALSTDAIVLACLALGLGIRLAAAAEPRSQGQPTEEDWQTLLLRFVSAIGPQ